MKSISNKVTIKKEKCGTKTMNCKRVVFNKAKKLCKFHDWETKITNINIWSDFSCDPLFHSLHSGKQEQALEREYVRRFSADKSCFKEEIKQKMRNGF